MGAVVGGMPTPRPCIDDKACSTQSCFFQRNEITNNKLSNYHGYSKLPNLETVKKIVISDTNCILFIGYVTLL
jgi:hypothetical protein